MVGPRSAPMAIIRPRLFRDRSQQYTLWASVLRCGANCLTGALSDKNARGIMKYVAPSITESAFNCPHCDALTTQFWYSIHANRLKDGVLPTRFSREDRENFAAKEKVSQDQKIEILDFMDQIISGLPFLEKVEMYTNQQLQNVWFSKCYHCKGLALWISDKLHYPLTGEAPPAADDMPPDVRRDYDEAGLILNSSPRGAAALLRLAIQKLCGEVGGKGANINSDIGTLVRNGLDVKIQMALDVVRVIGNNAVHPGQIDLRDDRTTAATLFSLVNLITERLVSEPKRLEEMYAALPKSAREAIERRDGVPKMIEDKLD